MGGQCLAVLFEHKTDGRRVDLAKPFTNNLCRVNCILRWTTSITTLVIDFIHLILFNTMIERP